MDTALALASQIRLMPPPLFSRPWAHLQDGVAEACPLGPEQSSRDRGCKKQHRWKSLGQIANWHPPAGLALTAASLQDGGQGQRGAKTTMLDLGCRRCWQRLQQQDQVLLLRTAVAKRGLR